MSEIEDNEHEVTHVRIFSLRDRCQGVHISQHHSTFQTQFTQIKHINGYTKQSKTGANVEHPLRWWLPQCRILTGQSDPSEENNDLL